MSRHFARTEKGHGEIAQGRRTLRGKPRTLLFLIEPGKPLEVIQQHAAQIGASSDALAQLIADGYVIELRPGAAEPGAGEAGSRVAGMGEVERFRIAKAFMNDAIVDALGIRAFLFTLRLERCATRADLKALMPDYAQSLMKKLDADNARTLVERTQELLDIA
jgi:hypothetical protein